MTTEPARKKLGPVESAIFSSRYLLVPMYFGLVVVSLAYTVKFTAEAWHVLMNFWSMEENELMLTALQLVDMVMVANLISMIVIGSQSAFVNDLSTAEGQKPQWLKRISSGLLKIKMGTSLIGVSSIHLLRSFINAGELGWDTIQKQLAIHAAFVLSSLFLAWIEWLTHRDAGAGHAH